MTDPFDLGALRDPDPPAPGEHERRGVEARARVLRARARRNRSLGGGLAAIAAVAAVVIAVAALRSPSPSISVEGGSSTTTTPAAPGRSYHGRFVPPTRAEHGLVVLPVTLADGEHLTLRYPPALRIAELGFAGSIGVSYPVSTGQLHCCGAQVSITYQSIADVYGDATPVHVYRGPNGERVTYFHASQSVHPLNTTKQDYLVFQFGPWLVQVYDVQQNGDFARRMTDAERATWARSLTGTLDPNGYLVLHARAPLSVGGGFDGGFGADSDGRTLELATHLVCGRPGSDSSVHRRFTQGDGTPGVSWCDGDLHVSATGPRSFVDAVDRGLRIDTAASTPPSTTTTTTTTPRGVRVSAAASASFVSPRRGYAAEKDGTILGTTDGGATWSRVGTLGKSFGGRIRFIDAADGFAFGPQAGPPLITHDGGATWSAVTAPFSDVEDLSISNGTIYVVGMTPKDTGRFGIWSSPVSHLVWKRDPRALTIGGGPIPSEQIVLAGSTGWILNVDRTVVSGARLAPNGSWSAWTPPCAGVLGPAFLTASTPTDLVAACEEHAYGGGPMTAAVYFSHDGGTTFTRHDAPGYGPVASPDPTTALLWTDGGLQRTTDGGASWRSVYPDSGNGVTDLGFTTSKQGFVILADGRLLMTHDAGASWQEATFS